MKGKQREEGVREEKHRLQLHFQHDALLSHLCDTLLFFLHHFLEAAISPLIPSQWILRTLFAYAFSEMVSDVCVEIDCMFRNGVYWFFPEETRLHTFQLLSSRRFPGLYVIYSGHTDRLCVSKNVMRPQQDHYSAILQGVEDSSSAFPCLVAVLGLILSATQAQTPSAQPDAATCM